MEKLMKERDRLYQERHTSNEKSVAAALAAVEKQTTLSFESQKEAVRKAEQSQKEYNSTHNDLLRRMDKQYEDTFPRREFTQVHADLTARIDLETKSRMDDRINHSKEITDLRDTRADMLLRREYVQAHTDLLSRMDADRLVITKELSDLRESRSKSIGEKIAQERDFDTTRWVIGLVAAAIGGLVIFAIQHMVH